MAKLIKGRPRQTEHDPVLESRLKPVSPRFAADFYDDKNTCTLTDGEEGETTLAWQPPIAEPKPITVYEIVDSLLDPYAHMDTEICRPHNIEGYKNLRGIRGYIEMSPEAIAEFLAQYKYAAQQQGAVQAA